MIAGILVGIGACISPILLGILIFLLYASWNRRHGKKDH